VKAFTALRNPLLDKLRIVAGLSDTAQSNRSRSPTAANSAAFALASFFLLRLRIRPARTK
jgi:hypothetical protein